MDGTSVMRWTWLCAAGLALAAGCGDDAAEPGLADAGLDAGAPAVPFPTHGWTLSTPEAEGMDPERVETSLEYAFQPGHHTQGVVVVRHGKIVAERYAADHGPDSWATSWSMGKSFTSTAVGIAVREGLIAGVDVSMGEFFPEWRADERAQITLDHALHMASGLDWIEDPTPTTVSDVNYLVTQSKDMLAYVLKKTSAVPPGTRFYYSSGDSMLLSGALQEATGVSLGEYAREKLFEPLGITQVDWWADVAGRSIGFCCVDMPTREYAKLALLYMRGGVWDGQRILSQQWVDAALRGTSESEIRYGYQIWRPDAELLAWAPADTFEFKGLDSQMVFAVPSLDLIVVRNGRYIKKQGEPVAAPFLLQNLPSQGIGGDSLGTVGPEDWDTRAFVEPILQAIQD